MAYRKIDSTSPTKAVPVRLGRGWELFRDGLTQGSINLFLQCRGQFHLSMVEGWTAKKSSTAIEFGSAFHYCLSLMREGVSVKSLLQKYMRKYKSHLTGEDKEDFKLILAQVEIVLEIYQVYWKKHDDKKDWVLREETFRCEYPVKSVLEFDTTDRKVPLRGRWDGLYRKKGKLWLHETKTKGQIDEEGIKSMLPFDPQTMLYCYAAKQRFPDMQIGGTLYDVIRRPQLKQGKNESPKAFLDRIVKDIKERPRWYFHRWEVVLQPKDLQLWEDHWLQPILRQIVLWNEEKDKGIHHFLSPKALFTTFGRCDLFHLITSGNTHGLYRRVNPYPELID